MVEHLTPLLLNGLAAGTRMRWVNHCLEAAAKSVDSVMMERLILLDLTAIWEVSQKFDLALAPGRSHLIHVPDFEIRPSVGCMTLSIQFGHEGDTFPCTLCPVQINKATQS